MEHKPLTDSVLVTVTTVAAGCTTVVATTTVVVTVATDGVTATVVVAAKGDVTVTLATTVSVITATDDVTVVLAIVTVETAFSPWDDNGDDDCVFEQWHSEQDMVIPVVSNIELVLNNSAGGDDVVDDGVGAGIDGDGQTIETNKKFLIYI